MSIDTTRQRPPLCILTHAKLAGVDGFMESWELEQLMILAAGRDVLEIGSFTGLSAWGMATVAKSVRCIDTFKANTAGQHQLETVQTLDAFLKATARFKNIAGVHVGSSEEVHRLGGLVGMTFGLVFIDAMHTKDDVLADIKRWMPSVRFPDGVIAFHDYGHDHFPGVKQAVDEAMNGFAIHHVGTLAWVQL